MYYIWFVEKLSQRTQTSGKGQHVLRPNQTSSRRLAEDVGFTSSWRRPIYNVLKTSDLRRLEDVWSTTSWRRRIYVVLKTSDLQRLEDVWFMKSWRRLIYDVLKTSVFTSCKGRLNCDVLKTSDLWRLEDVCKTTPAGQRGSDVYATSKEIIFSYLELSEIFRKFQLFCLG